MKFEFEQDILCPDCERVLPEHWVYNPDQEFFCPVCDAHLVLEVLADTRVVYEDEPAAWYPGTLAITAEKFSSSERMSVSVVDSEPGGKTYMSADSARETAHAYLAAARVSNRHNDPVRIHHAEQTGQEQPQKEQTASDPDPKDSDPEEDKEQHDEDSAKSESPRGLKSKLGDMTTGWVTIKEYKF